MTIVTTESWHPNWPLQETDVQFLGIGTLYLVKQSMRWVECMGPEGQTDRLRTYVVNITVNLWGHDPLKQLNTQINITAVPKTHVSGKNILSCYQLRSPVIQGVPEHKATSKTLEMPMALHLKWLPEKPGRILTCVHLGEESYSICLTA